MLDWKLPDYSEIFDEPKVGSAETILEGNQAAQMATAIEQTLERHGAAGTVREVQAGPTITRFGIEPGAKVKVSKIVALADDLALALSAPAVRIEAPIPGRNLVGIEIPNNQRQVVRLPEVLESNEFEVAQGHLKFVLGRDIAGQPAFADLTKMPHLLVAGATGGGKSVAINTMIASLIMQYTPEQLQFVMVDPKMVELSGYNGIPHLRFPVVTKISSDSVIVAPSQMSPEVGDAVNVPLVKQGEFDTSTALGALTWTVAEMERRYQLLAAARRRDITSYNEKVVALAADSNYEQTLEHLPYLVVIVDELADLMLTAPGQVETLIARIAQKARAVGIHLVIATQRPSADVVTGLIKANLPSRIAFAVASQIDSRVILDTTGAEKLLGRGDMLYFASDATKPTRVQGAFLSDSELERLQDFWCEQNPNASVVASNSNIEAEPVPQFPASSGRKNVGNNSRSSNGGNNNNGNGGGVKGANIVVVPMPMAATATSQMGEKLPVPVATPATIITDTSVDRVAELERELAESRNENERKAAQLATLQAQLSQLQDLLQKLVSKAEAGKAANGSSLPTTLVIDRAIVQQLVTTASVGDGNANDNENASSNSEVAAAPAPTLKEATKKAATTIEELEERLKVGRQLVDIYRNSFSDGQSASRQDAALNSNAVVPAQSSTLAAQLTRPLVTVTTSSNTQTVQPQQLVFATPGQEKNFKLLLGRLVRLPSLHQRIFRLLIIKETERLMASQIADWLAVAESSITNTPPRALLELKLIDRVRIGKKFGYKCLLNEYLKKNYTDTNGEMLKEEILKRLAK